MINAKGYTPAELGITAEQITEKQSIRFYSIKETDLFRVYGLYDYKKEGLFKRLPEAVAETVSASVARQNYSPAGGRVRFVTNSDYVAIRVKANDYPIPAPAPIAACGFDMYINNGVHDLFHSSFIPFNSMFSEDGMLDIKSLPAGKKEITINFPLGKSMYELYIGLDESSTLAPRADYKYEKPVLFYGSSITQGWHVSRPGLTFEAIISRKLDMNFINLGFGGACHGEPEMADYLSTIDCSAFVLDYDHNSKPELLRERHEQVYLKFRKTHPETPVIIVGRPNFYADFRDYRENEERRSILMNTYNNALDRGENVYFIDGQSLFAGEDRADLTVDMVHPNDLGMLKMADVIGKVIEHALIHSERK